MLPQYIKDKIKDIKENMTLDEIKDYFDNRCYMSKAELGEVINDFLYFPRYEILKVILSSKKFKENTDCSIWDGEPLVQAIMYVIQVICDSEDIPLDRRIDIRNELVDILTDSTFNLRWDINDSNAENPLHVALQTMNYLTYEQVVKIINVCLEKEINPLNRNIFNQNAFDMLFDFDYPIERKEELMKLMGRECDKYVINVREEAYSCC